jgi:hypothetical protein
LETQGGGVKLYRVEIWQSAVLFSVRIAEKDFVKALTPLLLMTLTACQMAAAPAYLGSDVVPTNHTLARHQYHGFSVEPPTGPDWFVRVSEQSNYQATYKRRLPSRTHTFIAGVSLGQLDKSLSIEDALVPHGFGDPDRYKVIEQTHERDDSRTTLCYRYLMRLVDKRAPNSPHADLQFIDRGLVCVHPTIAGAYVRAGFSERGLESEIDPNLWSGFEDFLRGVRIESAPGVPAS